MQIQKDKIAVHIFGGKCLVWNTEDVLQLRTRHRIVGALVGSLPSFSQQNQFHSRPMLLSHDETTLLVNHGIIQLVEDSPISKQHHGQFAPQCDEQTNRLHNITQSKESSQSGVDLTVVASKTTREDSRLRVLHPVTSIAKRNFKVFTDLYCRGMYITNASKFGGDYLAYTGDPLRFHALLVIAVVTPDQYISPLDLVALARLGVGVKKSCVLAITMDSETSIDYITVDWLGIT